MDPQDTEILIAQINSNGDQLAAEIAAAASKSNAAAAQAAQEYSADKQYGAAVLSSQNDLSGRVQAATLAANAQIQSANIDEEARVSVAYEAANAQIQSANIDATARTQAAQIQATAQIGAAQTDVTGRVEAAQIEATAQTSAATIDASSRTASAQISATAQTSAATIDAQARTTTATTAANAQTQSASIDATARTQAAQIAQTGQEYEANQQYAGVVLHETSETARLNIKLNYAEEKFEQVYPLVLQSVASAQNGNADEPTTPGLLPYTQAPPILVRGVFTPGQVQAQINLAYARNDTRTSSLIRSAQGDLAGRGFSSNSPLLEVLSMGYQGQNFQASNNAATAIRFQSAQANSDQILKSQELANSQFNQIQQVFLASEQNAVTRQVGLLGGVAQMVAGVS
jgi:hypothetical protein